MVQAEDTSTMHVVLPLVNLIKSSLNSPPKEGQHAEAVREFKEILLTNLNLSYTDQESIRRLQTATAMDPSTFRKKIIVITVLWRL